MNYSSYGLDDTKKSKDDDIVTGKWLCLWCNEDVSKGFGLCFSNWVICNDCVAAGQYHLEYQTRWEKGVECFKCKAKDITGLSSHPDNACVYHLCKECIGWAYKVRTGKLSKQDFLTININQRMAKKPLSEEALQVLKECTVDGNNVKLPERELPRPVYLDVKKHLELIGGKWKGGKTQAFVFESDPTELLAAQANGEGRDLKQDYQFFPTPFELAEKMINMLGEAVHNAATLKFLEPSAGDGAIIKALRAILGTDITVDCFELMELNRIKLKNVPGANLIGEDFLQADIKNEYDIIIANPPFTKNQDIDHIRKMYEALKPNGRIVTIASPSWTFGSHKKQVAFREWLNELGAFHEPIDPGAFKESGTNVAAELVVIDKLEATLSEQIDQQGGIMLIDDPQSYINALQVPELIPISSIIPDPNQPRQQFNEEELEELASSVKKHGVLQAILLRPVGDKYMIVFGERRWRASKIAQRTYIPANIRDLTDEEAREIQVIENLQRKDVHPMEEAIAFKYLFDHNKSIEDIAARVGQKPRYVASRLTLTDLIPELQQAYLINHLDHKEAMALAKSTTDIQKTIYAEMAGIKDEVEEEDISDDDYDEEGDYDYTDDSDDDIEEDDAPEENVQPAEQKLELKKIYNLVDRLKRQTNDLDGAPFKTEDPDLFPEMGACGQCPHNSINTPQLFIEDKRICNNNFCYTTKKKKAFQQKLSEAAADPNVVFVMTLYGRPDYGENKENYEAAIEMGLTILDRDKFNEVREIGELMSWEEYLENQKHWDDEDETPEAISEMTDELRTDYDEYAEQWHASSIRENVVKAFVVCGWNDAAGKFIEVKLKPSVAATLTDSEGVDGESTAEILKIQERLTRSKELDGEKVHKEVKNALKEHDLYFQNEAQLSLSEKIALLLHLYDIVGHSAYEKYLKEKIGWKEGYDYRKKNLYDLLVKQAPEVIDELINRFTREVVYKRLTSDKDNPQKDGNAAAIRAIAIEYLPEKVKEIDLAQEEKAAKRIKNAEAKIKALKKQSKQEPAEAES